MMRKEKNISHVKETWASGEAYEPFVGRWSQLVALQFIEWLAIPPGKRWLDVGCGTGALTQTILQMASPQALTGIDRSEGFINFARQKIDDPRAAFQQADAQALPVETASYDAVVSGLMLNFIPNHEQAMKEMVRATKPGGKVAVYVWDYAGKMQFMRHFWNAAAALDATAVPLDEGLRFPLCQPDPLASLFKNAGLTGVDVHPIDIWMVFKNFDDLWSPFLGGQGPAPSYVKMLSQPNQAALRERIRTSLPFSLDGSIPLMARAWAVEGIR